MRAIVNTAPGKLELLDWPLPVPGPGQARIRTLACGICSTDLEMISGWERTGFPAIPGHEWAGRVDAVGNGVDPQWIGKHCVAENVLADGGEVGFEHPGGYAEYLVTEAGNLRALPHTFPPETGALIEPLAVSVRALRRARLGDEPGQAKSAIIFGDGPIGLILVMLLKAAKMKEITLVGGHAQRLDLAKKLGASQVINYHQLDAKEAQARPFPDQLRQAAGRSYPVLFEASGSGLALEAAQAVASHGAHILVMGDYGSASASFPWNRLLHNEFEFIGSNASAGAWDEAVELAVSGKIPLAELITHRLPAERFNEGIQLASRQKDACTKVILNWG